MLMGIEHVGPQWQEVSILWYRLRLPMLGGIIRKSSRFLSPGIHTLDKALLSTVGRICEYNGTVLSLITYFYIEYILANGETLSHWS